MISFWRGRARLWNPDPVHLLPADRSDHRASTPISALLATP